MALKDFFTEVLAKLNSIEVNNPIATPTANNIKKTPSNVNKVFKYINIWDEQIDEEVKGNNYVIASPSIFIEYIAGDCKMLLRQM